MRGLSFSLAKLICSAALLYFSLRSTDFAELRSRLDSQSAAWLGLGVAAALLQIFLSALRWREIGLSCGTSLTVSQSIRFNLIGTFFNQTLPSSIGGDAMRIWLSSRGPAGLQPAAYSVFIDRTIGLLALAVMVIASLPWSYALIDDPKGRAALLFVDFAALAGGICFILLGRFKRRWMENWPFARHAIACSVITNRLIFDWKVGPKLASITFCANLLTVVIAWSVIRSISAPPTFWQIFLLIFPVVLITMVPVSIAGWGLREATMGIAFGFAGLAAHEGINVSLLFGGVWLLVGAIGGLVWILGTGHLKTIPVGSSQ